MTPRPVPLIAAAAASAALALAGCGTATTSPSEAAATTSTTWPGCSSFTTQAKAQAAWERDGRPKRADGDGDGRVCESLTSSPASTAKRPGDGSSCTTPSKPFAVGLSRTRYPETLRHAADAIANGSPRILVLNRPGASERRAKLLAGRPTRKGYDLDEYPPAIGRKVVKADVRSIPSADNRGSGSTMGTKLRRFCDGTRFYLQGY